MDCSQTGYDSIPGSTSIPELRKYSHKCILYVFLLVSWLEKEKENERVLSLTTVSWLQEVLMGLYWTTMPLSGLGPRESASSSESLCKAFSW